MPDTITVFAVENDDDHDDLLAGDAGSHGNVL